MRKHALDDCIFKLDAINKILAEVNMLLLMSQEHQSLADYTFEAQAGVCTVLTTLSESYNQVSSEGDE